MGRFFWRHRDLLKCVRSGRDCYGLWIGLYYTRLHSETGERSGRKVNEVSSYHLLPSCNSECVHVCILFCTPKEEINAESCFARSLKKKEEHFQSNQCINQTPHCCADAVASGRKKRKPTQCSKKCSLNIEKSLQYAVCNIHPKK